MDDMDRAADVTDFLTAVALKNKKRELPPKHACYNCDEPLKEGVFCDSECREDHDKRTKMNVHSRF